MPDHKSAVVLGIQVCSQRQQYAAEYLSAAGLFYARVVQFPAQCAQSSYLLGDMLHNQPYQVLSAELTVVQAPVTVCHPEFSSSCAAWMKIVC